MQKLRSDAFQKRVDRCIRDLNQCPDSPGKETENVSQKGGGCRSASKKKVAWPHEVILGGARRQRLNYNHLSIPQYVSVGMFWMKNVTNVGKT